MAHELLLSSLLPLAILAALGGPVRAGDLEPFLARLAGDPGARMSLMKSPQQSPTSGLLAWLEDEAARGRVLVHIVREPQSDWAALRDRVLGVAPETGWQSEMGDLAQAIVMMADLERIANVPGVAYVTRPPRGVPVTVSEGIVSMRVPEFRNRGYSGERVRIAVLDLGFKGYQSLLGTDLPADVRVRSFYGNTGGNGDINGAQEIHGTACAEIVNDVAPGAQLYLVNVLTIPDLQAAVDWLISEKVSVITHSVGWYWGGLDGTGTLEDITATATAKGILWVNAAGNEALRHTWTIARDENHNRILELTNDGGAEELDFSWDAGHSDIDMILLWDSWPYSTDADFGIDVVDHSGQVLRSSSAIYPGTAAQVLTWNSGTNVSLRLVLRRGALNGHVLHLFRRGDGRYMYSCQGNCPGTRAQQDRSVLAPADAREVLAVGASDWQTGRIHAYSSRDSVAGKPEIYGPSGVTTATYTNPNIPNPGLFFGTSAAAPHVAGAAALLASAGLHGALFDVLWARDDLGRILRDAAAALPFDDLPLVWGIVRLPAPPSVAPSKDTDSIRLLGNPAWGTVRWSGGRGPVTIYDAQGRIVAGSLAGGIWDGRTDSGAPASPGIYWIACAAGGARRIIWLGGQPGPQR
jgi:subtilisin family serine protease